MTNTMLIDSHVNLHHEAYADDRADVIARARSAGVGTMITICDKIENADTVLSIAQNDANIWATVGAHPHFAKDHRELTTADLVARAADRKIVGIGECGLDLHYTFSPLDDQVAVFRAHIHAARETGLPLIVHTREANSLTAGMLEEEMRVGAFPLLMHCYTSGVELARRALAIGAVFSFSGIMTFKNAHDVRAIASEIPLDRVILETDCPYLTPVPHRGRRCEPMHVADVYASFARLRGLEPRACEELIAANFHRLFARIPVKEVVQ